MSCASSNPLARLFLLLIVFLVIPLQCSPAITPSSSNSGDEPQYPVSKSRARHNSYDQRTSSHRSYNSNRLITRKGSAKGHFKSPSAAELRNTLQEIFARDPKSRVCPAPRWPVPERACRAAECSSPDECGRRRYCCYNGCKFTCIRRVTPPAVIDWPEEPRPVLQPVTAEPAQLPVVPSETSRNDTFMENTGRETVFLPGGCLLTRKQYNHMQEFMNHQFVLGCSCVNGSVQCKVGKKSSHGLK